MGIANNIYLTEINAFINVVKVEEVSIFQKAKDLRDGLSIMRKHYEGTVGSNKGGVEINLVHALLGQEKGGGIAFISTYTTTYIPFVCIFCILCYLLHTYILYIS